MRPEAKREPREAKCQTRDLMIGRGRLGLALTGLVFGLALLGEEPQLYRWKDQKGIEHVTNTPPPRGTTVLDVPPLENKKEPEQPLTKAHPIPLSNERSNPGLSLEEQASWRSLGIRLRDARAKGDHPALERAADEVVSHALWGNGIWALTLLPLAILALLTLLGWWAGSALQGAQGHALILLFLLVGLGFAHLCLVRFVYKLQTQRIRTSITALQTQLLEPGVPPTAAYRDLLAQGAALEECLHLSTPPWHFPERVAVLKDALRRAVVAP